MPKDGFYGPDAGDLADFRELTGRSLSPKSLEFSARVERNVPIYDMGTLSSALEHPDLRPAILAEWAFVLGQSAGVLVLAGAYLDPAPIDAATAVFEDIIARERAAAGDRSDHFAAGGANDRIWNALQKLAEADPAVFVRYYANTAIAAVSEAWLGPNYQVTSQINVVRPGGAAQTAHRDYHLGFQTAEMAARYPAHAHALSAALTLQGAVAHCEMPVESGPTKLLPFSHLFPQGYLAYRRPEFAAYFEENAVQLPLAKGDAVFFNPALFHAAGANVTADISRMANLLQVSSAFGRAMESVDRAKICRRIFPELVALTQAGALSPTEQAAAIAAAAEGYPFPTNLDTDPPVGGLAPESQADLMRRALSVGMTPGALAEALSAQAARQYP